MKNEHKITKMLMMSWAREFCLVRASDIILAILWSIVGFCGLILLLTNTIVGGDMLDWLLAFLFLFLSAYKLFFGRFVYISKRYKMFAKTYGVDEWLRTIEFLEGEIVLTDHTTVNRLQYHNIKKVIEKGNVVLILMNDNIAFRLYKNAFVDGSWEECKELLTSKRK
ncbi:MAG: YcxB family protein [Clostridia bacterium]|nr:YcxB family protein [Clostridia bacterium]